MLIIGFITLLKVTSLFYSLLITTFKLVVISDVNTIGTSKEPISLRCFSILTTDLCISMPFSAKVSDISFSETEPKR